MENSLWGEVVGWKETRRVDKVEDKLVPGRTARFLDLRLKNLRGETLEVQVKVPKEVLNFMTAR